MLLAFFGFGLSFLLGMLYPRKAGWFVLATFPLLYAMYAIIIPSSFFPLSAVRFAFAVTVGILFSNISKDIALSYLTKLRVVVLIIIFIIYVFFLRGDESLMSFFGTYAPGYFLSIVLPFLIIQTKSDLYKLARIFSWQGAIVGFFVIIEYFTEYNPYDFFVSVNQSIGDQVNFEEELIYRGGFKRVAGLAGNAVDTGYLLALYFPVSIWLLLTKRNIDRIPIFFITIGIVLLQTRATFIALGVSLVVMWFFLNKYNKGNNYFSRRLIRQIISFSIIATVLAIILSPGVFTILSTFFSGMFGESEGFGVESKMKRIPTAFYYFIEKPFGHGSPSYAYNVLMGSDDLPAPVIYFLAGGFILGTIYLLILYNVVFSVFNLLKIKHLNELDKIFIILTGCGILAAVIVVFSNWREKHLLTTFMLYVAIIKIYYIKYPSFKIEKG
jgi:hypothetical protein